MCILFIILTTCLLGIFGINKVDYLSERNKLLELDAETQIGHDIVLSKKEQFVETIFLGLKEKELKLDLASDRSLSEKNFVLVKDEIDKSAVYQLIRQMPKGAVLHIHDMSIGSYKPLIKKWTYDKRCFMCFNETNGGIQKFKISLIKPKENNDCVWTSVVDARVKHGSPENFDAMLLGLLTITPKDIQQFNTQNDIWRKFQNIFTLLQGLFTYHEAFKDYWTYSMEEILQDNIQYAEIRATLLPLYYLNGTTGKGGSDTLKVYIDLLKEFRTKHNKDFLGAKFIFSVLRSLPSIVIKEKVLEAIHMYETYPSYFAGFDLVGQEDSGFSLLHFKDELLIPSQLGKKLPYFFHAGETDWQGESVDSNLFDAVLLNTSRIGHAFALAKHPYLKEEAKRKNISIELCPISNQVLGLVADLRDHPAVILMTEDHPITISSDDPAIWNSTPMSHDMYQVVMAMTPAKAGLRVLKKLALNSILYSDLTEQGKEELLSTWSNKWDEFLDRIIKEYSLKKSKRAVV